MNIINIISALLVPFIGGVTTYIAIKQHRLNQQKHLLDIRTVELTERQIQLDERNLKLQFYEKRFRIFIETRLILRKIIQDGGINSIELNDFVRSVNETKFLFDSDISDFMNELRNKAQALTLNRKDWENDRKNNELAKENRELFDWFRNEYEYGNIEERFMLYLNFKDVR